MSRGDTRPRKAPHELNGPLRRFLALLPVPVVGAYLIWRAGWTLNGDALWLSLPLLIAETHGYLTYLMNLMMTWDLRGIPIRPPGFAAPGLRVDVLIATYNEPSWILAPTIAGAVGIRYPHETYVLDDGERDWVRQLCQEMGARYLARPTHEQAKAGNINHALQIVEGDFFCVLDADFVPAANFIDELAPYFEDPSVAVVQEPQEFYNLDSFQHAGPPGQWHDQASFYRVIQVGKNRTNSAFWCGTPSMLRRQAILEIGGVVAETLTEDLHTSLRLHKRGWRTIFHPRPIARGVAPEDYDGFILQRLRWARGAMQVVRREWRGSGLSPAQRLSYIASTMTYLDSYRKLAFLVVIPIILLSDTLPIDANATTFIAVWDVQMAISVVALMALGRSAHRYFATEMFDLLKMFAFILASLEIMFARPLRFLVTPKGDGGERHINGFLWPTLVLIGVYVGALLLGGMRVAGAGTTTSNETAIVATLLWGTGILGLLIFTTWRGYEHVTRRRAHRIRVKLNAELRTETISMPIIITDMTLLGAAATAPRELPANTPVRLAMPGVDRRINGIIRSTARIDAHVQLRIEFEADPRSTADLARAIAPYLASKDPIISPEPAFPVGKAA